MAPLIKKTDSEIQQDVLRELKWDTRVKETEIGVEVDQAVVTLTGTVDHWAKRMAAQEAAHRVAGVLDVANDVEIRLPGSDRRTDTDIAKAVRQALEWDVFVPDTKIRSTVTGGVVALVGEVDAFNQREDAERAIRNLAGVVGVANRIKVKAPTVAANEVQQAIEAALERHAEREAKHLTLEVRGGKVVLGGTVRSWAEREAVIGAARGTRGVQSVDDHLRIEPHGT